MTVFDNSCLTEDFSLLMGVHQITEEEEETASASNSTVTLRRQSKAKREARKKKHISLNPTTIENILPETQQPDRLMGLEGHFGGIPARNKKGEKLCLYLGLIDILQCYKSRFLYFIE